ncbi:MAG: hypothetical protein HRT57_03730 [Crocinitomicaceae bacterium]|nr:hypothetical protein [Crocinitomicaceae bacterium]
MLKSILLSITLLFSAQCLNAQPDSTLNWPDTSNWVTIKEHVILIGLEMKLPPNMKYYAHSEGITLFINDDVSYSINEEAEYNDFDMAETRNWLDSSEYRADLVWLIDEDNIAYYTGQDLSATSSNKTTHSCYGELMVAGRRYTMSIDGITFWDGNSYHLSQEECLTFITILKSMRWTF